MNNCYQAVQFDEATGRVWCDACGHERFIIKKEKKKPVKPTPAQQINALTERIERLRTALVKLRDCDWIITPSDRMEPVRAVARKALADDDKETL